MLIPSAQCGACNVRGPHTLGAVWLKCHGCGRQIPAHDVSDRYIAELIASRGRVESPDQVVFGPDR